MRRYRLENREGDSAEVRVDGATLDGELAGCFLSSRVTRSGVQGPVMTAEENRLSALISISDGSAALFRNERANVILMRRGAAKTR